MCVLLSAKNKKQNKYIKENPSDSLRNYTHQVQPLNLWNDTFFICAFVCCVYTISRQTNSVNIQPLQKRHMNFPMWGNIELAQLTWFRRDHMWSREITCDYMQNSRAFSVKEEKMKRRERNPFCKVDSNVDALFLVLESRHGEKNIKIKGSHLLHSI